MSAGVTGPSGVPLVRGRWTPRTVAARGLAVLRTEGPRNLAFRVLGETGFRRMIVMQRAFDVPLQDVEIPVAVAFAPLAPEEIDDYLRLRPDADPDEIRDRFRRRHVCFGGRLDGRLVQACWVAGERARIDYLGCWIQLASGVGYLHDLYTAPEVRGRNLHRAMYPHMFRYFRNTGSPAVVAAFQPENDVQLIFERLGFRAVSIAGSIRLGPFRRVYERRLTADVEQPAFRITAREDP